MGLQGLGYWTFKDQDTGPSKTKIMGLQRLGLLVLKDQDHENGALNYCIYRLLALYLNLNYMTTIIFSKKKPLVYSFSSIVCISSLFFHFYLCYRKYYQAPVHLMLRQAVCVSGDHETCVHQFCDGVLQCQSVVTILSCQVKSTLGDKWVNLFKFSF